MREGKKRGEREREREREKEREKERGRTRRLVRGGGGARETRAACPRRGRGTESGDWSACARRKARAGRARRPDGGDSGTVRPFSRTRDYRHVRRANGFSLSRSFHTVRRSGNYVNFVTQ